MPIESHHQSRRTLLVCLAALVAATGCSSLQVVDGRDGTDVIIPDCEGVEFSVTVEQGGRTISKSGTVSGEKVSFGSGFGEIDFSQSLKVTVTLVSIPPGSECHTLSLPWSRSKTFANGLPAVSVSLLETIYEVDLDDMR